MARGLKHESMNMEPWSHGATEPQNLGRHFLQPSCQLAFDLQIMLNLHIRTVPFRTLKTLLRRPLQAIFRYRERARLPGRRDGNARRLLLRTSVPAGCGDSQSERALRARAVGSGHAESR
ncbi:hypothetical protein BDW67DRAFT_155255 [Aspergillus spinulosporus]